MREGSTALGIGRKPIDFVVSDPADSRVAHAETLVGEPERVILHELRAISSGGVVEHEQLVRAPRMQSNFATALGRAAAATPWFRSDPNASINRHRLADRSSRSSRCSAPSFSLVTPATASSRIRGRGGNGGHRRHGGLIARSMAARTTDGSWVLGMALAYRNTLRHEMGVAPGVVTAHEHAKLKMPWLETPDALILWAVALGLADEVGHLISRSVNDPASVSWHPVWYIGSGASLASFGSSISSISVTAASSTGGGYGGGSARGGGGGGGGGF